MKRINDKNRIFIYFIIITIISIFCNACVFLIANRPFFYFYLLLFSLFIYVLFFYSKHFIKTLIKLYKYTPFKYYAWFIFWLIISACVVLVLKKASIAIFYYIFVKLFPVFLLCYLLSAYFIPKYLSVKQTIKLFTSLIWGILVIALIGFLGELYNVKILKEILNAISNVKFLAEGVDVIKDDTTGLPRARGVFSEPGGLGQFITIMLPIIYKLGFNKYCIYKNRITNRIIKNSLIPLAWICLICTFSPISLIFGIIISVIFFAKRIVFYIKKYISLLLIMVGSVITAVIFLFIFDLANIASLVQKSFLSRILTLGDAFRDYSLFVEIEGSLASRITSWTNSFILFLKSPIYGYGYDNVRFYMYKQFLNSPLPLTKENINNMIASLSDNIGVWYNRSLLFGLLAETGIIGTFLYFKFLFKNIEYAKLMLKYFTGIEVQFLSGMVGSIWIIILTSFYSNNFSVTYLCFLYGLFCSYALVAKDRAFIIQTRNLINENDGNK